MSDDRSHLRPFLIVLVLVLAASSPCAQSPAPTTGARSGKLDDPAAANADRAWADTREFSAEIRDGQMVCTMRMQKPFAEGMFTCVELEIDCDDKSKSGIGGAELLVRAAVGSRFQPNAAEPTNGTRKAIDHLRLSTSVLAPEDGGGKRWLHEQLGGSAPTLDGNVMRFAVPIAWIKERGDRYSSRFSVGVAVRCSCSDQPLELLHSCGDEGLPIVLDGKDGEWSGVVANDPPDELHGKLACADLVGLRVDQSDQRLFLGIGLAQPGFTTWREDDDVRGRPILTLHVEPLFPRYQDPMRVRLPAGSATQGNDRSPWMAVVGERFAEASFPRKAGQSRYRVLVQSDVEFEDRFGGRLTLDWEAK
ncbi:MAG: hypothetical protein U1F60_11995 [Planctomycetota bacterium]